MFTALSRILLKLHLSEDSRGRIKLVFYHMKDGPRSVSLTDCLSPFLSPIDDRPLSKLHHHPSSHTEQPLPLFMVFHTNDVIPRIFTILTINWTKTQCLAIEHIHNHLSPQLQARETGHKNMVHVYVLCKTTAKYDSCDPKIHHRKIINRVDCWDNAKESMTLMVFFWSFSFPQSLDG